MIELTLQRLWYTERSCCGELAGLNVPIFTLELPIKDGLPGSAIPPGRYKVMLAPSPKFMSSSDAWVMKYAQQIPHIQGIPNRSHILIHWGNTPENTDGCILVGLKHDPDMVSGSRPAFDLLYEAIEAPASAGECFLRIQGGLPMLGDSHEEAQDAATAT